MGEKSIETEEQKACQIAILTEFKLYHGKPEPKDQREFSKLCNEIIGIMKRVRFMSMPRMIGEYNETKHIFYSVPYKHAEEIKQKIIDSGLAKKVYIDEF